MLLKLIPTFFKYVSPVFPRTTATIALKLFSFVNKSKRSEAELKFWQTGESINLSSKRAIKSWGSGPEVWLIHGWASRGSTYYKIIPQFTEAGYKVITWDGPAHGDSPGYFINLVDFAKALANDIKENKSKPHAIIGHSFGGASMALLLNYMSKPNFIGIIGAPAIVPIIFSNFKNRIKINDKAFNYLINKVEKIIGQTIESTSLISNDLSLITKVIVIHDTDDKEVPYDRFQKLQKAWSGGAFITTSGLGHHRIIKSSSTAQKLINFIS